MRLRTRLILLMVATTALPLAAATTVGIVSTRQMGERLSEEASVRRQGELSRALSRTARSVEEDLTVRLGRLQQIVAGQAEAYRLAWDAAGDAGSEGTTDTILVRANVPGRFPPGVRLRPSASHALPGDPPVPVADDRVSVRVPDDVPDDDPLLRRQQRTLDAIRREMSARFQGISDLGLHLFFEFENGAIAEIPADGRPDLRPDSDPRLRPIYGRLRRGQQAGGGGFEEPAPVTGRGTVSLQISMRDADEAFLGIAGARILIDDFIAGLTLPPDLATDAAVTLFVRASSAIRPDGAPAGLPLIAVRGELPSVPITLLNRSDVFALVPDDPATVDGIIRDLNSDRGRGSTRLIIDGEAWWASYGGFGGDAALGVMALAPEARVLADAAAARRSTSELVRSIGTTSAFTLLLAIVPVVAVAAVTAGRIARPISRLSRAARRIAGGDLDARADVRGGAEIHTLATAFNEMVPRLRDHLRMRSSLDLARTVQERLVPRAAPSIPGCIAAGHTQSCDEVGGDYLDFVPLPNGHVLALIGDAAGHGVAAALMMTTARSALRSGAETDMSLAERVAAVNRRMCADAEEGRFLTFGVVELRPDGGGTWIGAGQEPLIVHRPLEGPPEAVEGQDLPLGLDPSAVFTPIDIPPLAVGDRLVIVSDGLREAPGDRGRWFGEERLLAAVQETAAFGADSGLAPAPDPRACEGFRTRPHSGDVVQPGSPDPERIIEHVLTAAAAWRGDRAADDDVTIAVIVRTDVAD